MSTSPPPLRSEPAELTGKLILTRVVDDNQRPMLDAIERAEHKKGTSDPLRLQTRLWRAHHRSRRHQPARSTQGSMPLRKLFAAYLGTESTIPRGQVAYDLERSRALLAALIASIGQVGQEFAKRWREKFEPAEIERRAAANGHGLLTSKDARAWRAYRDLANETSAAQMEKEVLAGLAAYAESLLKSIR